MVRGSVGLIGIVATLALASWQSQVSARRQDTFGTWSSATSFETTAPFAHASLNTTANEGCPAVSVDGRYLLQLDPPIVTPQYPAYAGNVATVGASAARALELVCGTNDIPVTVTWTVPGLPSVAQHFDGFSQAAEFVLQTS